MVQASTKTTLEPMIFNMPTLMVVQRILDDTRITKNPAYSELLHFCK